MTAFVLQGHKWYFKVYSIIWNLTNISQYSRFYCIFEQINAALLSVRGFFQKH